MTTATRALRGGTRASRLARWQTARVVDALRARVGAACEEVLISTEGDRTLDQPLPEIGGKGVFTEALEAALRDTTIDFAVHSLKDLPVERSEDLVVAAVCSRADPRDVVIARDLRTLATLPRGARVGTSSTRRIAQLRAARPDLAIVPLRGNVDTRVRKALAGDYDAIVIAAAGVERLGLGEVIAEYLPYDVMLPAPGQGALAVQCRADDRATRALLETLDDPVARATTTAERAFLEGVGGGCAAPIAALGEAITTSEPPMLRLTGLVASVDGRRVVRVAGEASLADAEGLAHRLADDAIARGVRELLR
ncbi:MAG: hydroxymethylbilane synthase [Gemmatimonadales bacterium]